MRLTGPSRRRERRGRRQDGSVPFRVWDQPWAVGVWSVEHHRGGLRADLARTPYPGGPAARRVFTNSLANPAFKSLLVQWTVYL